MTARRTDPIMQAIDEAKETGEARLVVTAIRTLFPDIFPRTTWDALDRFAMDDLMVRKKRGRKRDPALWAKTVEAYRLRSTGKATRKEAPCIVSSDAQEQVAIARLMDKHAAELESMATGQGF